MQIKASPNLKAGLAIGTSTIKLFNKCLSKLIIQKKNKDGPWMGRYLSLILIENNM